MSNTQIRTSNAVACTTPKSTDKLLGASYNTEADSGTNYQTVAYTYADLTKNVSSNNFVANNFSVTKTLTPSDSANTTGLSVGQMWCDANYLYVVTSNTVIKRVALSTF